MRKLHLDPEALEVQSFETSPGAPAVGTVRGHGDARGPIAAPGDSGCVATYDPCTCVPIETCSCGPDTPDPTGWR
ncbi:MAG TPA: hypothetical protein VGO40_01580 [Longimicrobium sp.]|jgi:hypothetical protein|nr:hypothetical protein [Longimicrobium sp.]